MRINNFTPFVPLLFKAEDHDGDEFTAFMLKGTFRIVRDAPMVPVVEQSPITVADEYYGAPFESSLRRESDLVPIKANLFKDRDVRLKGNDSAMELRLSCFFYFCFRLADHILLHKRTPIAMYFYFGVG